MSVVKLRRICRLTKLLAGLAAGGAGSLLWNPQRGQVKDCCYRVLSMVFPGQ
jgi:hypothetical protein